jgi:hypothetical protein
MNDPSPTEQFGDALRAALLAGKFPNPNREGCPEERVLKQMGAKRGVLPVGHPVHVHVMQCSPCFQHLEGFRSIHRRRRTLVAAAAAVVVVAAGYGVYREWPNARELVAENPQLRQAVVDLRPYTVERSDRPANSAPQPLRLPRCRLQAVIYLPVGVETGSYELRILDTELKTKLTAPATANMKNFETIIETQMDLQALSPGKYTLAIRRAGEDWRQYALWIDPK